MNAIIETTRNTARFTNKELEAKTAFIFKCSENAKINMLKIAYTLADIDKNELYKTGGFDSTAKYAEKVFGYSKSNTSMLISTANACIEIDENGKIRPIREGFGITQLYEISRNIVKALELIDNGTINPKTSAKKIREMLKSETETEIETETETETKTETETETETEIETAPEFTTNDLKDMWTELVANLDKETKTALNLKFGKIFHELKQARGEA